MGSRANYAIIENGSAELFYSHWGAQRVDRDFFFGPDVALTVIRATRPEPFDHIMNDIWCEGGALVDMDGKRLIVWGGEDIPYDVRLRQFWLELVRIGWEGWNVEWADHGIADLADQLDIPIGKVVDGEPHPPLVEFKEEFLHREVRLSKTFVTVLWEEGDTADYLIGTEPGVFVTAGPALLDHLRARPRVPIPFEDEHWPNRCMHIDTPRRTLHLALGRGWYQTAWEPVIGRYWPGWDVRLHGWGMPRHLELTGRDPAPYQLPLEAHLPDLVSAIRCEDHDPADLSAAWQDLDVNRVVINPSFFQKHRLVFSDEDRVGWFLRVLSLWKARRTV